MKHQRHHPLTPLPKYEQRLIVVFVLFFFPKYSLVMNESLTLFFLSNHALIPLFILFLTTVAVQSTFNIDIDYNGDDDALLEWEQYSKTKTVRCCGWTIPLTPPTWWFRLTKRQRRFLLLTGGCLATFTLLLILLMAAAAAGKSFNLLHRSSEDIACEWTDWRLPGIATPTRYNLTFDVQMESPWGVEGEADVGLQIHAQTRCLVLHAVDLVVREARIGGPDGSLARATYNDKLEQLTLTWEDAIPAGSTHLWMRFDYAMGTSTNGLYRSTHSLPDGSIAVLAATQFEANSARAAFPCFDEPAMKAVFSVEVITASNMKVLSNTPARAVHAHAHQTAGTMTWHFEPTPPMSTYLLAVVIGPLEGITITIPPPEVGDVAEVGGTSASLPRNVTVWATPDQIANLEFAASVASKVVPYYERTFGVAYPLPKLDLVAVPDFSAGAMENWGLITFRPTSLLVSPTSSDRDRRHVTKLIAHEVAHQWFGNLVTMDWWNDLWLNEGFASYLEYLGANAMSPGGAVMETYYPDDVTYALRFDTKAASHAMSVSPDSINSTDRTEALFDAVEYERGGAVLRMVHAYLNRGNTTNPAVHGRGWEEVDRVHDPFLSGLEVYLKGNAFNSTTATDLWTSLSGATDLDLPGLMETWTFKSGYPLVTITMDGKRQIWAKQGPLKAPCDSTEAWWIPLSFVSSDAPATPKWAELNACQSLRPLLPTLPKGGWVKVNAQQVGYYRVNYAPELWAAIIDGMSEKDGVTSAPVLRSVDVAGLLDDAFALSEGGIADVGISTWLDLLRNLPKRPSIEYAPWAVTLPALYKVDDLVPCQDAWRTFVRGSLIEPSMQQAGVSFVISDAMPVTSAEVGLLRPMMLRAAGYFGVASYGQEAFRLFESPNFVATNASMNATIDLDVRGVIYEIAARSSPDAERTFDEIKGRYIGATEVDEKERTLKSLAASPLAVPSLLDFAMTDAVRAQDLPSLIIATAASGGGHRVEQTWSWLEGNWERVRSKFGRSGEATRRLGQIVEGVASLSANRSLIDRIDALYARHGSGEQADPGYVLRGKEAIDVNAAWVERHGTDLCTWLSTP